MTVDEMLAWLRDEAEAVVWFGCHWETPLTSSPVELCVIADGQPTYRPNGATLHEALEAACAMFGRGVANPQEDER